MHCRVQIHYEQYSVLNILKTLLVYSYGALEKFHNIFKQIISQFIDFFLQHCFRFKF